MEFNINEELLFYTPLWSVYAKDVDNTNIKKYCLETREKTQGVQLSNKGGWHSREILTPLPVELESLFKDLTEFVNTYCAKTTGISGLELGNFWVNINSKHDYNLLHDHLGGVISGVYYVDVPTSNMGNLILERNDNMEYFLPSQVQGLTPFTSQSTSKQPLTGMTYLFPAFTRHRVDRNDSDLERISIAFNFVLPK